LGDWDNVYFSLSKHSPGGEHNGSDNMNTLIISRNYYEHVWQT